MTPSYVYVAYPRFVLDLRSGTYKSPSVPPPRPYRKMVVHSPNQFEVQRAAAAAAAANETAVNTAPDAATAAGVPPSVLAASTAASNAGAVRSAIEEEAQDTTETGDLLGGAHDFDVWHGDIPPGQRIQADIHTTGDERNQHFNVTTRRGISKE